MGKHSTATEALQKAMDLERQGFAFYRQAEERTADPEGKAMFRRLARDESDHLATIQRQFESLESGQGWVQDSGVQEAVAGWDQPPFPPTREAMEARVSGRASDLDALHFALELEHKAYTHYAEAARQVGDTAGKAIYEYLSGLERSHFDLLMLNYETLATYGRFLGAKP